MDLKKNHGEKKHENSARNLIGHQHPQNREIPRCFMALICRIFRN